MTQRVETAVSLGIAGAGLASSFMGATGVAGSAASTAGLAALPATAVAGIAASTVGLAALGYGTNQYFTRREETGQIHDVMKDLVSGSSASGLIGRGTTMRESSKMMRELRMAAAYDPTKSIEDYHQVLQTGAATGLFNFEDESGEITGKVKQASKMVNMMMMLAGDPDIQSTVKRMADFQAMGISIGQMDRMATDIKGFANLANSSFEEIMARGGAIGAQQMQQMGGSAAFGMRAGGMAQGMANRMLQSGVLTPEEAALRGGKSGIMQTTSGILTTDTHSYLSSRASAFMTADGKFDEEAFNKMVSGTGGNQLSNTLTRFGEMDRNKFLENAEDVTVQAQATLTPIKILQLQKRIMEDTMAATGMSKDDYIASKGPAAKNYRHMLSDENMADQIISESRVLQEKRSKEYAEIELAQKPWNVAARNLKVMQERVFNLEIFDNIAEGEDRRAAAAAAGVYVPAIGDTSWMSESARERFRESSPTELGTDSSSSIVGGPKNIAWEKIRQHNMDKFGMSGYGQKSRDALGEKRRDIDEVMKLAFEKLDLGMQSARLAGPLGYMGFKERQQYKKAAEEITKTGSLNAGALVDTNVDIGTLLQYVQAYGTNKQKNIFQEAATGVAQGKALSGEGFLTEYDDMRKQAESDFGKEGTRAYINLLGEGLTESNISELLEKGMGDPSLMSRNTKTALSKMDSETYTKVEGLLKEFGTDKNISKLKSSGAANLKGAAIDAGRDVSASEQRTKLAKQLAFSGQFSLHGTTEDIKKQKELEEEATKLNIDVESIKGEATNLRVATAKTEAERAAIKSEAYLSSIEAILKRATTTKVGNLMFGG